MTQNGQTDANSATTNSSPHWLRHYFDCLRCPLCGDFYVADASSPKAPQHLHCASAMCKECFDAQKALKSEERSHTCRENYTTCFDWNYTAFYLFDAITYFSEIILAEGKDFIESLKEPRFLECSVCSEIYSLKQEAATPFHLLCGHICCFGCYKKVRLVRSAAEKTTLHPGHDYVIKCPQCNTSSYFSWERLWWNEMHGFLRQLGSLKSVFDIKACVPAGAIFKCGECKRKIVFDDVWQCGTCDKVVCGTCSMHKHRTHSVESIAKGQIGNLAVMKMPIVRNQLETYKEMIPHHLSTMSEAYDRYLEAMEAGMKRTDSFLVFGDAQAHTAKLLSIGDRLEKISEEVIPVIRKYQKDITDFVDEIDQCASPAKKKKTDEEPKNVQ